MGWRFLYDFGAAKTVIKGAFIATLASARAVLTVLGVLSSVSYLPINEAFLVWLLLLVVMVGLLPLCQSCGATKTKGRRTSL